MIDHIGFTVADLERSRGFYAEALRPLAISLLVEVTPEETGGGAHLGFGANGKPFFWLSSGAAQASGLHVAFTTPSRAEVRAFYDAALKAGGRDNGPPGLRPHYHAHYYGAFVLDPDGNNIEAVCHLPE